MSPSKSVRKILAVGSAALAAAGVFAFSASAQLGSQNTSCEPYNAQWNVCTVYQYDFTSGAWVPVDSFFQYVGEAAEVPPDDPRGG